MQFSANDPNFTSGNGEAQFNCFATFVKKPYVNNSLPKSSCWISPKNGMVDSILFSNRNASPSTDARFNTILTHVTPSGGDPEGYMLLKYTNLKFQDSVKVVNGSLVSPYFNNNLVLFRLSDIYLLDAEALAQKGDLAGAKNALSYTEQRAGISSYTQPATAGDMLVEVVKERGRELIGEGQWFYDLIRTEPYVQGLEAVGYGTTNSSFNVQRTDPNQKGYYWPLNMTQLFPQDNLLTQNPWWTSHK
jgi:hypothetical protein